MFGWIKKIFGTAQSRKLRQYKCVVAQVNQEAAKLEGASQGDLQEKTREFQKRLREGESINSILPEAYAVVKRACALLCGTEIAVSGYTQKWDMIPYDVQILGAVAMHYGCVAEMQTGEGKTLTASMPLYLNALTGSPVHLVTVNDYLAVRDCSWVGSIFTFLGLSVAALVGGASTEQRKKIYKADIVYGTASEFGFDYLRDNAIASSLGQQVQRGWYFAIVDEADSVFIDDALTPMIISGPAKGNSAQVYRELSAPVSSMVKLQKDFCDQKVKEVQEKLQELGFFESADGELPKSKREGFSQACRILWLVSKGAPACKLLRKLQEYPLIRNSIEQWDIHFHAETQREERQDFLGDLYVILDERASDFEITDKGIQAWESQGEQSCATDFTMLDLGYEYEKIASQGLSEQERMEVTEALHKEDLSRKERSHALRQLFRAYLLMEKNVAYIVHNDQVVIIDEHTGRPQSGRRFSEGLHQALEAKEGVTIQAETQTYASVTLQNYFRMYEKLSGMTGTAMTDAYEFKEIYGLDVLAIPTHRPCIRIDADDQIYMTEREKYEAIVKEIQEVHAKQRPILVGTESVEISEIVSRMLRERGISHTVLNAKSHEKEAEIIARAGTMGAITVATNMAGRGTDIKLAPGVGELGGLHVVGTSRHTCIRNDRQYIGRAGRLGDPGSSKFFVSFEDSLLRLFANPGTLATLKRFRPPEGEPVSAKILNKSIEAAQKRLESRKHAMRKRTLEYDNVMNKQRQEIYSLRNALLREGELIAMLKSLISSLVERELSIYCPKQESYSAWNTDGLYNWAFATFPVQKESLGDLSSYTKFDELQAHLAGVVMEAFENHLGSLKGQIESFKEAFGGEKAKDLVPVEVLNRGLRPLLLRHLDQMWQEHLMSIEHLQTEVNLQSLGQKDPLQEFKHEAFSLFQNFCNDLKSVFCGAFFKFQLQVNPVFQGAHFQKKERLKGISEQEADRKTEGEPSKIKLSIFDAEERTDLLTR